MVAATHRILRAAVMCIASFLIFNFAIDFVMEGPLDNATLTPWFLVGGVAFKVLLGATDDGVLALITYAAWQIPVCLALYFGPRRAPT